MPVPQDIPQIARILPEVVLTIVGILIMLADGVLSPKDSRRSLGWLAIVGTIGALAASIWQFQLPAGTAYSGTVQTDAFSVFFHVLICGIVLVSLLVSLDATKASTEDMGAYYALVIFGATGMLLMTCAVELLVVFIGLEISSISTYIMAGFRKKTGKSPEAALKYFLLGSFATAFFLYGIALTFGATGTTRIADIATMLPRTSTPGLTFIALAMILIGLGFKVSAAPFHLWTPDVYEGAPSPVVGLMSTAPKAAAFAVLLRIVYYAYPSLAGHWSVLIWIMAALSMTVGNLGALRQQNVKRMLAYSSIAHAGYLLVAFTALSRDGIAAASFYSVTYAAMNVGIFAVISHVGGYEDRLTLVQDYRGLGQKAPILAAAMAFFLISLIGIPFTGGFFGKFYVFTAAIHSGLVWLAVLGLINSAIAAYYYLRLLVAIYAKPVENSGIFRVPPVSWTLALALFLTVAATFVLGVAPGHVLNMAQQGALTLSGPGSAAENPVPVVAANQ